MNRGKRWAAVTVGTALALLGYGALDVLDVAPGPLTRSSRPQASPRPLDLSAAPGPGDPAAPLAPVGQTAPTPTSAGLRAALASVLRDPALGASVGLTVRDGVTGASLLSLSADAPRVPASTAKILTAAAVAATLPTRLGARTALVRGRTAAEVVLVAGGDTLLSPGAGDPRAVAGRAGMADLARLAATGLRAAGVASVRLSLDTATAQGPGFAPGWPTADVRAGFVGPVAMLGLTAGRAAPGRPAAADPAMAAAVALRTQLVAAGVAVDPVITRRAAPRGATSWATVTSAPVADVLALALTTSDNALTESLARRAAVSQGAQPSFAAVGAWVVARLGQLGVDVRGARLADASGLSRDSAVPARVTADVLARAAGGADPDAAAILAGLPVAGLTGTLEDRYAAGPTHAAAGRVRAKTGTLNGVSGLAGLVVDADGRSLVFAASADRVPRGGTPAARAALDRLATVLAGCGCR